MNYDVEFQGCKVHTGSHLRSELRLQSRWTPIEESSTVAEGENLSLHSGEWRRNLRSRSRRNARIKRIKIGISKNTDSNNDSEPKENFCLPLGERQIKICDRKESAMAGNSLYTWQCLSWWNIALCLGMNYFLYISNESRCKIVRFQRALKKSEKIAPRNS